MRLTIRWNTPVSLPNLTADGWRLAFRTAAFRAHECREEPHSWRQPQPGVPCLGGLGALGGAQPLVINVPRSYLM